MYPVIGITCQTKIKEGEIYDAVARSYICSIKAAKGTPLILPLVKEGWVQKGMVSVLDGLLLSGGSDINPELYSEDRHPATEKPDKDKDDFEMDLTRLALQEGIPILGIGRGQQLLAVAVGGTLYQDIPAEVVCHVQRGRQSSSKHLIILESHTRLKAIFDSEILVANSHHHQAIKDLPSDFRISTYAEDGVIEAIEKKNNHFIIGVQFHPEEMWEVYPEMKRLFIAFVSAAKEYHILKTGGRIEPWQSLLGGCNSS